MESSTLLAFRILPPHILQHYTGFTYCLAVGLCIQLSQLLNYTSLMTTVLGRVSLGIISLKFFPVLFGSILDLWAAQPLVPGYPGNARQGLPLLAWASSWTRHSHRFCTTTPPAHLADRPGCRMKVLRLNWYLPAGSLTGL